jgi:hypothetical protein
MYAGFAGHGLQVERDRLGAGADGTPLVHQRLGDAEVDRALSVASRGPEEHGPRLTVQDQTAACEVFRDQTGQQLEDFGRGAGGAVGVKGVVGEVEIFGDPVQLGGLGELGVPVGAGRRGGDVSGGPGIESHQEQIGVDGGAGAQPGRVPGVPVDGGDRRVDEGDQVGEGAGGQQFGPVGLAGAAGGAFVPGPLQQGEPGVGAAGVVAGRR